MGRYDTIPYDTILFCSLPPLPFSSSSHLLLFFSLSSQDTLLSFLLIFSSLLFSSPLHLHLHLLLLLLQFDTFISLSEFLVPLFECFHIVLSSVFLFSSLLFFYLSSMLSAYVLVSALSVNGFYFLFPSSSI